MSRKRKSPKHGWWDKRDVRQFKGLAPHFSKWQKQLPPPPPEAWEFIAKEREARS
jgi:hypothetical protein